MITIFDRDGTLVYVNDAVRSQYGTTGDHIGDVAIGGYNVLDDPSVRALRAMVDLPRAFNGETVRRTDASIPDEMLTRRRDARDRDAETVHHDVMNFPLIDADGRVAYVVSIQAVRTVYRGRLEIEQAKHYLDEHWRDAFDLAGVAKSSGFSRSHFARLFKKHTGRTPHQYYVDVRIGHIKEKLADPNLSIYQVFSACGVQYHGRAARVFKERTGLTPSEYRRSLGLP